METWAATYARLRTAQKGRARGAPAYSIYVNRPVGRALATIAYRLGLTPDQVTAVSAVFTFSGVAVLAAAGPQVWSGILGWFLLALGYAWDSADGQVARLRGGGSLAGEWLDHFVDAIKISAVHLAVLVGLWRVPELDQRWLFVPLVFTVIANATFFGMILNDLLKAKKGVPSAHNTGGASPLRSLLLLPTDYGLLMLAFVLWGWPQLFIVVYALLLVAAIGFLALAAPKWYRDMRRVDVA